MAVGELLCCGMQKIWSGTSHQRNWCWCCVLFSPCTLQGGQESPVTNDSAIGRPNPPPPQRITGKKKGQVHSIYSHNFTSCAHSVQIMKINYWVLLLFLCLLSVPDLSWVVLARTECCVGREGTAGKLLAFRFKKCQCNSFLNAAIIRTLLNVIFKQLSCN